MKDLPVDNDAASYTRKHIEHVFHIRLEPKPFFTKNSRRRVILNCRWNMDIGILDQAKRVAKDNVSWSLSEKAKKDINSLTLNDIFQSAKNGDELSQSLVENGGINLGRKIAFLVNLLNPEIVVIGGGLEAAGSLLMDAIKTTVKKWTIDEVNRVLRIVPAQFAEKAVALGVSCVVSQNIFMKS